MKNERCNLWFVVILISVFTVMLQGCENNDSSIENETFYSRLYADSVYLGFEGDLLDPLVIWGNMDIYSPAYERMRKHLRFKDNQLQWDIQNGEEMKISENIFNYITMMWDADNEMLKSGKYDLKLGSMYYEVVSKELKMLSRGKPSRKFVLKSNNKQSFEDCFVVYREIMTGDCICDWIDFSCNFKPDGFGGMYVNGYIDFSEKEDATVQQGIYFAANTCVKDKEYRCEQNYCRTNSVNQYSNGKGNQVVVLMRKNGQHAPILTIQLTYR